MMMCSIPEATHSSTTYWICGLSTTVSISLGCALVAGKKRVPSPAAGRTALRTLRTKFVGCGVSAMRFLGGLFLLGGLFFFRGTFLGTRFFRRRILAAGFFAYAIFCGSIFRASVLPTTLFTIGGGL